jgi:hypothetical protein
MGIDKAGRNIMGWTAGHLRGTTNLSQSQTAQRLLGEQYRVAPDAFWHLTQIHDEDGYDRIKAAQQHGWRAVSSWGLEGWDLGAWPLVVILHCRGARGFELAYDVEGDITVYQYPTREVRDAATDCLAFWHWKHAGEDWVDGVESIDVAPDRLRGPFSQKRLTTRQPWDTRRTSVSS